MSGRTIIGQLAPEFNPFDDDYLSEILGFAAIAWARMRHPDGKEIEDHITLRLAGILANDSHFTEIPFFVAAQHLLVDIEGHQIGRIDLYFKHRYSQRDYFAFEAKRLHVRYPGGRFSSEYPTYVGNEGMMAFIDGQYSKDLPACGMLGYVMDGNCNTAWDGLKKRINNQRLTLRLVHGSNLRKSALLGASTNGEAGVHLGETEHDLQTRRLRIFHLLLPLRCV